jgi:DNA-binding transcriptional LysR family regulator
MASSASRRYAGRIVEARQLAHVLAVAEHRSFRAAAESIGLTQPALSRSIRALEDQLGVRIFDRARGGIRPTPLGKVVLEHARDIVGGLQELRQELALHQGLEVGTLAVGVGPVIAETRLGPTLAQLVRERPGLRVSVRTDHWHALTRALEADEIELFAGEPSEVENDPAFRVEPLAPDPGVFFGRADHPLARRRRVTLDDVRAQPLLGPRLPPRIAGWLYPDGAPPRQVVECESFLVLVQAVLECDALGAAPLSAIAHEARARRVKVLPVRDPRFGARAAVVSQRARTLSPGAEAFIKTLLAVDRAQARADAKELRAGAACASS